ncbi:MAG TPA: LysM domain-containing protein [Dehalococcoidia bacterium]|nr:LysM domain-containing protein [Dehalococcoidia bacterium]
MDRPDICSFCGQPGQARCRRCSRTYCAKHGAEFCAACSNPGSSLPSQRYVRAALWAFPVCVILGLWFLLGTPRLPGEQGAKRASAEATAGARSRVQPAAPTATPTPGPTATSVPTGLDYTVKEGDTLALIADASGVTVAAIMQLNPSIDPAALQIGQVLHMPARSP